MFFAFLCSCLLIQAESVILQHNRRAFVLDGEWSFNLSEPAMSGKIIVPGAWEAQGYGSDADRMRWQVLTGDNAQGKMGAYGIYAKQAHPVCDLGERAIFIVDSWIHRHAVFKIDGKVVGEHRGYLTPFEVDVTAEAADGKLDIEITLDGGRNTTLDGMMGAADLDIAFGESLGGWAGLNGHVIVECRPPFFVDLGKGSVMPPQVTHSPVSSNSEGQPMDINVSFSVKAAVDERHHNLWAAVTIARAGGQAPQAVSYSLVDAGSSFVAQLRIPSLAPWSVESPALYNATISLHPCESCPEIDSVWTTFGVRTLVRDGYKFMLNGRRLFLTGYGDDSIYPLLVSPPRDKEPYAARLELIKKLGFNFARHHSTTLPREYFDATDELGMLISPEIPCSYPPYYAGASKQVLELYNETWNSRILQLRNHPSIMVWSTCNEGVLQLAEQFYKTAKEWDPTRLVLAVDGGGSQFEDYESRQFDFNGGGAWGAFEKLAAPGTYYDTCNENGTCSWGAVPDHPVISHETGNYMGFPRLSSLLAEFQLTNTTIKPFWLTPVKERIQSLGFWNEAELWAAASEYLYTLCWKIDIEDLRHNVQLSGFQWWLLQDYWQASDGIFDVFFRAKPGISWEMIQSFNAPSILLQSGLKLAYSSEDNMSVIISVSNYGSADITNGTLTLTLQTSSGVLMHRKVPILPGGVRQGDVAPLFKLNFKLPDIGNTSTPSVSPVRVQLTASFDAAGFSVPTNSWNATVFPRFVSVNTPPSWTLYVTEPILTQGCGFWNCQVTPLLGQSPQLTRAVTWNNGVYLARDLSQPLLSAVRNGSVAVIMPEDNGLFFPSDMTRFKLAWWLDGRGDGDNNGGVVAYPSAQQILGDMTINGFPDQTWYWMIEGSHTFLMDDIDPIDPAHDQIEVMIRAIDGFKHSRNKALVFKMKVGKGTIIMSGLRTLEIPTKSPEKAWVLTRLMSHAADIFVNGSSTLTDTRVTYV